MTEKYVVGHIINKKKRELKHRVITKWIKEHRVYKFLETIELI